MSALESGAPFASGFAGTFNGGGHTVSNIAVVDAQSDLRRMGAWSATLW